MTSAAGGDLTLSWSASCSAGDVDYAIYEGTIGNFYDHVPVPCSSSGATSVTLTPGSGDRYYLVVPQSIDREGSHGQRGDNNDRPQGPSPCQAQEIATCFLGSVVLPE